jgi:hypothetical protein
MVSMLPELAEQLQPIHLRVLKAVSVIPQHDPEHPHPRPASKPWLTPILV